MTFNGEGIECPFSYKKNEKIHKYGKRNKELIKDRVIERIDCKKDSDHAALNCRADNRCLATIWNQPLLQVDSGYFGFLFLNLCVSPFFKEWRTMVNKKQRQIPEFWNHVPEKWEEKVDSLPREGVTEQKGR